MRSGATYDVIVIGGGHAGAEAAWAAAKMLHPRHQAAGGERGGERGGGGRVALVTMDPSKIGAMSCNPAIGGLAKGQIVREIDAMGGLMGLAADATGIQFKVLNASKGPAVRGPRCQSDKYRYAREVRRLLATRPNLDILAGTVEDMIVEAGRCTGVLFRHAEPDGPATATDGCCGEFGAIDNYGKAVRLTAGAVVLTTGTFMRGLMHTGTDQTAGGRAGEDAAVGISGSLQNLGFELGRLKTGTPPRLDARTIDFSALEIMPGDTDPTPFSTMTDPAAFPALRQVDCHTTYTNAKIHDAIRANLGRAPMYNGQITTDGPRYCPSIEDKVVRFADRSAHHVFLEPESLETHEIYCNGISTSLPADVQAMIVANLPGCAKATLLRPGYAVEYDMVLPHQIDATCMTKRLPGLLLAGQINGTSGYEEAAGQGLVAGINAVGFARQTPPDRWLRLGREQAYIGVMLDDLVTKTPREPYRMFTSRAEHRLVLRADNADTRLTPLARDLGLIDEARWAKFVARRDALAALDAWATDQQMDATLTRPGIGPDTLLEHLNGATLPAAARDPGVRVQFLADRQYAGYIARNHRQLQRLADSESQPLPTGFDYQTVTGLRNEAAQVLNRFQPATLGQAGRLAGVNPTDLMLTSVALSRREENPDT